MQVNLGSALGADRQCLVLASEAVSGGFLAAIAVGVALAAWYWGSPWPVVLGAAYVALVALSTARGGARGAALLWSLTLPARPMRMHWSFSVSLTDRVWETLRVPQEKRAELQQRLGEYKPLTTALFAGHPTPAWISQPITVSYERWGESVERWTIWNSWGSEGFMSEPTYSKKRVLEFLPVVDDPDSVILWGLTAGLHFRYENRRLLLLYIDRDSVSLMPDGKLHVKDEGRVLFRILAPTLGMSRAEWFRVNEPNRLDRFATPNNPGVDGFDPAFYHRRPGQERFECVDWARGFRWDLEVNDLRPTLTARVTRVRRSLWRRQVTWLRVELRDTKVILTALPQVVEPAADGRMIPKKGEHVWVVLDDEGAIDRIWMMK